MPQQPFVVVFILILSRNVWFDGLGWSPFLAFGFVAFSVFLVLRTYLLRRAAEATRKKIFDRLQQMLVIELAQADSGPVDTSPAQLEKLINFCVQFRQGALAPWFRHPILQALPIAGLGTIVLESLAV